MGPFLEEPPGSAWGMVGLSRRIEGIPVASSLFSHGSWRMMTRFSPQAPRSATGFGPRGACTRCFGSQQKTEIAVRDSACRQGLRMPSAGLDRPLPAGGGVRRWKAETRSCRGTISASLQTISRRRGTPLRGGGHRPLSQYWQHENALERGCPCLVAPRFKSQKKTPVDPHAPGGPGSGESSRRYGSPQQHRRRSHRCWQGAGTCRVPPPSPGGEGG